MFGRASGFRRHACGARGGKGGSLLVVVFLGWEKQGAPPLPLPFFPSPLPPFALALLKRSECTRRAKRYGIDNLRTLVSKIKKTPPEARGGV